MAGIRLLCVRFWNNTIRIWIMIKHICTKLESHYNILYKYKFLKKPAAKVLVFCLSHSVLIRSFKAMFNVGYLVSDNANINCEYNALLHMPV